MYEGSRKSISYINLSFRFQWISVIGTDGFIGSSNDKASLFLTGHSTTSQDAFKVVETWKRRQNIGPGSEVAGSHARHLAYLRSSHGT